MCILVQFLTRVCLHQTQLQTGNTKTRFLLTFSVKMKRQKRISYHFITLCTVQIYRCLALYNARLYETLFESKEKYSRKLLNIPTPEFYVFYNGEESYPSDKTLKLSEAFIETTSKPNLELTVTVNKHKQAKSSSCVGKLQNDAGIQYICGNGKKVQRDRASKRF